MNKVFGIIGSLLFMLGGLLACCAAISLYYGEDDLMSFLIDDLTFPSVTGNTDGADLVRVLESQVNASWAGRLGKTVVRIVLMFREIIPPVTDK